MASYRKSPEAERDLIQIWKYIASDNRDGATKFVDRLHGLMRELANTPGRGRQMTEFGAQTRVFPINDFMIFYREIEAGIEVIRVLSGRRERRPSSRNDTAPAAPSSASPAASTCKG